MFLIAGVIIKKKALEFIFLIFGGRIRYFYGIF